MNEVVGVTATEAAVGIAPPHAVVLPVRLHLQEGVRDEDGGGISPPRAACCSGSELPGEVLKIGNGNCPVAASPSLHDPPNLTATFKDGPVVVTDSRLAP